MKINDGLRLEATYDGQDCHGHHILKDVRGDMVRSHAWLNGERSNFPDGIQPGTRVRFFACLFPRRGGARLTDCRQVEVIQ